MNYDAHCCIVGGGPAGMVLALLLGRAGIQTTILEEHEDFERDFRGDTVHPSTMELMDALGLADRLLELPHAKIDRLVFDAAERPGRDGRSEPAPHEVPVHHDDAAGAVPRLPGRRAGEAAVRAARHGRRRPRAALGRPVGPERDGRPPAARRAPHSAADPDRRRRSRTPHPPTPSPARGEERPCTSGAGRGGVDRSLPEDATVRGVHYRTRGGQHDLRAPLTIGADGRFSRLRRLAGFELESNAPPMDVIWFRLPRRPGDPEEAHGKIGNGHLMVILNRGDEWQIAYVIAKGAYKEIHDAGLPAFRRAIAEMAPELADRVDTIQDWHQTALLAVEAGRVKRWFRPGLLLIGDAAHVMSPVGGVGINYAIQDAVVASNVLESRSSRAGCA